MNKNYIIYLLSFVLLFTACKTTGKTGTDSPVVQKTADPKKLSESQRNELTYTFMNANKEKILGNTEKAAALFAQCIRIDGSNDASMYELSRIYYEQGRVNDALFFAKSASSLKPDNIWYQLLVGDILQKQKRYSEAADVYTSIVKNNPDRVDLMFNQANLYSMADKSAEAIKIYDKIEKIIGINPELSVQKQQLYSKLGKEDKAIAELQKLMDKFPLEVQYIGMMAEYYQSNGQTEKAMELYARIEKLDPGNPFMNLSLADYYRTKGDKEKSFSHLKAAFASPKLELDTKIQIISSYYAIIQTNPELMGQALTLCKEMVLSHPNEAKAFAVYGDMLAEDNQPAEARIQYRKSVELDQNMFLVWQQLMAIDLEQNDMDALLKDSEQAMALFPSQPLVYYFNGIAESNKKNYSQAATSYKSGVALVVDNKNLEIQFWSNLGDTYHQIKDYSKSDEAYDKALKLDSNNVFVLNNYAYYLSLRNEKLEKAAEMSALSNKLEPGNPSFEDTYGWILYKQGKYPEAKIWLEKAMSNGAAENGTILEHMGDVQYKMGKVDDALRYWELAMKTAEASPELEKKIKDRKMYD